MEEFKEALKSKKLSELLNYGEIYCSKEDFFSLMSLIWDKAISEGLKIEGPILTTERGLNKLQYNVKKNNEVIGEISYYYGNYYLRYKSFVTFSRK
ncbi:hypothetical protein [Acidianus brierleyi]|nr:hypothetical protein [Acidianus brierleyi]AWR95044.2 hypothetical protein DFR85_10980 [Acidianus brierleyi]